MVFWNLRCISGHSLRPWVNFEQYEQRFRWVTFIRDANERFISLYVHQQTGNDPRHKMDIRDWANKFNRKNGMVRFISGENNLNKAIDILETKNIYVGDSQHLTRSLAEISTLICDGKLPTKEAPQKMLNRDQSLKDEITSNYYLYSDCIDENNELDRKLVDYVREKIIPQQTKKAENIQRSQRKTKPYSRGIKAFQLKDKLIYSPYHKLTTSIIKTPSLTQHL